MAGASAFDSKLVKLLFSEERLIRQLQLHSEDIEEVEDSKNRLDAAVAKNICVRLPLSFFKRSHCPFGSLLISIFSVCLFLLRDLWLL